MRYRQYSAYGTRGSSVNIWTAHLSPDILPGYVGEDSQQQREPSSAQGRRAPDHSGSDVARLEFTNPRERNFASNCVCSQQTCTQLYIEDFPFKATHGHGQSVRGVHCCVSRDTANVSVKWSTKLLHDLRSVQLRKDHLLVHCGI